MERAADYGQNLDCTIVISSEEGLSRLRFELLQELVGEALRLDTSLLDLGADAQTIDAYFLGGIRITRNRIQSITGVP